MVLLQLACIAALGLGLSRTWLDKPFYEDDGNWFYFAVLRNRGMRINSSAHVVPGHFGIHWVALQFARLFDADSPRFFYALKAAWLTATSLALYGMVYLFTADTLAAFMSAMAYTLVWTTPNTLYLLTYAEHFFLLPLIVAVSGMRLGMDGSVAWFALAGVMTAWSTQFKIINTPLLAVMPVGLFWAQSPWWGLAAYGVGAAVQILLPLAVAPGDTQINVLQSTYRPLMAFLRLQVRKHAALARPIYWLMDRSGGREFAESEYVETVHARSGQLKLSAKLEQVSHCLRDLSPMLVLACAGAAALPFSFEPVVLLALVWGAYFLAMQQVQQNYFTPHFSPIWLGVAVAAGVAAADTIHGAAADPASLAVYVLMAAQLAWLARVQVRDREPWRRDMLGYCHADKANFLRVAQTVGEYVRDNSGEDERLLVWGNHPAVYLYARRRGLGMHYLFTYGHGTTVRHDKWLFKDMQEAPPEWIVRYNNAVPESWNIENISGRIGVQYDLVQRIQIKDPKGRVARSYTGMPFDYPIYRRNDVHYLRMLKERARAALGADDAGACKAYLDRALALAPEDVEARLLAELAAAAPQDRRGLVEARVAAEKDPAAKGVAMRLLAALMHRSGEARPCLATLTKAMPLVGEDPAAMLLMGTLLVEMGEVVQGAQMLNEIMRIQPHSPLVMRALAAALVSLGQPEDAAELRRRSQRLVDNDPVLAGVLDGATQKDGVAAHKAAEGEPCLAGEGGGAAASVPDGDGRSA